VKKVLRFLLLSLNLVCVLLLLLSTLTEWVSPSQMSLPSLLSYVCPYLFVINALWVVFWLCFVRKAFLISLAAILLRMGFIPQYVQLGGSSEVAVDDASVLRVMTFNVHGFRGPDDTLSADSGAARFVALLHREQPDVLSLEEFTVPRRYALLDTLQAMGYRYRHGARDRMAGVVLFSKYPVTPVAGGGPGKVYTDIEWRQHTLRFVSVHLNSYRFTSNETLNLSSFNYNDTSARSIFYKMRETIAWHEREWRDDLQPMIVSSPYPVVVAGDFNDTPASYIYQQMSKLLNDAFVKQGRGFCTTYHGQVPSFRIDHIFCSDSFYVQAYRCIASDISDHYPVMAVLAWNTDKP